ncbi:MAG: hypothetical protein Q9209_007155 [Squamulea sp. 1 TL-2023]
MLDNDRARISREYDILRTSFERLQEEHALMRAEIAQLHVTLAKRNGDLQTLHLTRNTLLVHCTAEKTSRQKAEARMDQTLKSLGEFANAFYLSRIDETKLTTEQQELLKNMDYPEVIRERDALKARCFGTVAAGFNNVEFHPAVWAALFGIVIGVAWSFQILGSARASGVEAEVVPPDVVLNGRYVGELAVKEVLEGSRITSIRMVTSAADSLKLLSPLENVNTMSSNGLPTPENTPGPDPNRLAADKIRGKGRKGQPTVNPSVTVGGSKSALVAVPESEEEASSQPEQPSQEASQVTQNEDVDMQDDGYTVEQRENANRVIKAYREANYYEVLGLTPPCSKDAIKSAWRKTAKSIHPDKSRDEDADENMKMLQRAYLVLVNDEERAKWEQDPAKYRPPEFQGEDVPTFGEEFAPSAFGNDSLDRAEHIEKASPHIESLLSMPENAAAIRALRTINTEIQTILDNSDDTADYEEVQIPWEKVQSAAKAAEAIAHDDALTPEVKTQSLQTNKDKLKSFVEDGDYPVSWYEKLPPVEESGEVPTTKQKAKPKLNSFGKPFGASVQETKMVFRTKNSEPVLGYSNVGRGHQFIVEVRTEKSVTYDLRSGAEIGFHVAEAYLGLDEDSKVHLGESDKQFGRKDAHRYLGVYGVASKPLQTGTVGGRSRLPTAWVLTGFGNDKAPDEKVWLTRTTVRKICGKASADEDIRTWYLDRGLQPVDEIPPKVEKRRADQPGTSPNTAADTETMESLTAKIDNLTKLVAAMQSMYQQPQQQKKA